MLGKVKQLYTANWRSLIYLSLWPAKKYLINYLFVKDTTPGKAAVKTRRTRDIIPKSASTPELETQVDGHQAKKRKIVVDEFTLPSKACVRSYEREVHLPLALKSIAEEVSI